MPMSSLWIHTNTSLYLIMGRKVTCEESKMEVKVDVNDDRSSTPTTVKQKDTHVESPGTSIKESVQDVVLVGGHHVIDEI